jgi:hypothetical protein
MSRPEAREAGSISRAVIPFPADLLRRNTSTSSFRGVGGLRPPFFALKNADAKRRLCEAREPGIHEHRSVNFLRGPCSWIPGVGRLRRPFLVLKNADAKRRLRLRRAPEWVPAGSRHRRIIRTISIRLAAVYARFTEGFAAADLRAAQALLECH